MGKDLQQLTTTTGRLRGSVVGHPVYRTITEPEHVAIFMRYHVFAVWDFMTLLKGLQRELTCVDLPWRPHGDAETRYLINEIVVGEECDVDADGVRMSHFEMYLQAMQECGADTSQVLGFMEHCRGLQDLQDAFDKVDVPMAARAFVQQTFDVVREAKPHVMAAVFTFGREELIPDMFLSLVRDLEQRFPQRLSKFKYYLERHIEVDGGHHGRLALRMLEHLCGNDAEKWAEATAAVEQCLMLRAGLWDGVADALMQTESVFVG